MGATKVSGWRLMQLLHMPELWNDALASMVKPSNSKGIAEAEHPFSVMLARKTSMSQTYKVSTLGTQGSEVLGIDCPGRSRPGRQRSRGEGGKPRCPEDHFRGRDLLLQLLFQRSTEQPSVQLIVEACVKRAVVTAPPIPTRGGVKMAAMTAAAKTFPSATWSPRMWYALVIWACLCQSSVEWIVPQPRKNVWVTLAQAMQQDHLCLSTAATGNPLSTCLVGIPFQPDEYPKTIINMRDDFNPRRWHPSYPMTNPLWAWQEWSKDLPKAPEEPQELELLGSAPSPFCVQNHYRWSNPESYLNVIQPNLDYRSAAWCNGPL
ncbi:uncharacterized protein M8220_003906 [Acridotheres tristis]